jgi:hypothetical protein
MGYAHCAVLTPEEVMKIDPSLEGFCKEHSTSDETGKLAWHEDSVALWRPGGCIDSYLKNKMGDSFRLCFNKEVIGVAVDNGKVVGLEFKDGSVEIDDGTSAYVFCPGEAIGPLERLGFREPAYAAFAGPSLLLNLPLTEEEQEKYRDFSHCMEVHGVGIVLAWQARCKGDSLFIGVAGTKAFYGDKQPNKDEDFAKDRNLVQLNMINDVLTPYISLACGYDTQGKKLSQEDLSLLESKGLAKRWVGRRAVAYDGFPTLGALYYGGSMVSNARCTTHLGSGGASFAPAAIWASRSFTNGANDSFVQKILHYGDSGR